MRRDVVEKLDDWFILPLDRMRAVEWVERPYQSDLVLRADGDEAKIHLPPSLREQATKLVANAAVVVKARVSSTSVLEVTFAAGQVLAVPPDEKYEAWQVLGPGRVMVVAPAGGGEPAIWDANTKSYTIQPGEPLPPELAQSLDAWFKQPKGDPE
jgi:hypothetical protein